MSEIAGKAAFDAIRYAQLWEDADVLTGALGYRPGATLVSICSAGDNALAMLTLDPEKVVVVDLSPAQIACLKIRIEAFQALDHPQFLELMGARPSQRRDALLSLLIRDLGSADREFWEARRADVVAYGLGGVGKFERYFRVMQRYLLPLVHSQKTIDSIFQPGRSRAEREAFLDGTWNNRRWKLLLEVFFSRFTMGRLGRDPAFFDHVEGSVADHVARRIRHAAVDLDPSQNPYLHWILKGAHGRALPMPWRPEHFSMIRDRLDRLDIRLGSLEAFVSTGEKADGFNLSDIFEYMTPATFETVYGEVLAAANPAARLVYWNMMAPRRLPSAFAARMTTRTDLETAGKAADRAFFYSDFVVEELTA